MLQPVLRLVRPIAPKLSWARYNGTREFFKFRMSYRFQIEIEREEDGRWIAEIPNLPGVMAYGKTKQEAVRTVRALALRVLADRIERAKSPSTREFSVSLASAR